MNKTAQFEIAKARLVTSLASITGPRFVGVTYRSKSTGELARHTFIIGADYRNTVEKSLVELNRIAPTLHGIDLEAANKVQASLTKSLLAIESGTENPDYTKAGMYESICPGLKISLADGSLELCGLSHGKTVIEAGEAKPDTRRPLTVAQDKLKKALPIGKYRTLAIDAGALESVRVGGSEIEVSNV